MLGYGLIMTCHLKENYDDNGHLIAAIPDLNNRCLKVVNGLVDVIGVITQTWNEKGQSERWIQTRSTPQVTAGSRFRFLAPKIPFSYEKFVQALADAIDEEVENGAVAVDHLEIKESEELNFKEVRAKAQELWTKIVGTGDNVNQEAAIAVLKKIEMTMGRKMKLSEFTEDQTDLLALVVLDMESMI